MVTGIFLFYGSAIPELGRSLPDATLAASYPTWG